MTSTDKHWAKEYILDPLTAPQPADETGPGTHFRPPPSESSIITSPRISTPPRSPHHTKSSFQSHGTPQLTSTYPSPPLSSAASPHKAPNYRTEAFSAPSPNSNNNNNNTSSGHRRRTSSLSERYPGDTSHRPLSQLTQEKALADKARHATKKHQIRPDTVDLLDSTTAGGSYHHGGPYDATLFARNNSYNSSPVAAVADTNNETLKATPKDKIADSLERHRPLDGVASYAPGETDRQGNRYDYEAGENMMVEHNPGGGAYKRWPGVQYHPDDIKGKGDPSYSIEKALKDHERDNSEKRFSVGEGMEMVDRTRRGSGSPFLAGTEDDDTKGVSRSDSLSKRLSGGLKKRIGSIQRRSRHEE